MKSAAILFHVTAAVTFVQLVLGALLVFNFLLDPTIHIITGLAILGLAIATMVVCVRAKPPNRQMKNVSITLAAVLALQAVLGVLILATSSNGVVVIHFTNAMIVYALAVVGVIYARAWNKTAEASSLGDRNAIRV